MKKLKMKSNLKYTILFIIDLIIVLNISLILKDVKTINDYRYNMIILFVWFFINGLAVVKIEKK